MLDLLGNHIVGFLMMRLISGLMFTEEELYECPKFDSETMMEMPGMDAMNCDVKDNNFCARGRERCCQFGQGTHCIPKESKFFTFYVH